MFAAAAPPFTREGMQSVLHPAAGSSAAVLHELGMALYVGAGLIFVFIMLLLLRAVFSSGRSVNARLWVVGGGVVFPVATLSVLLAYSLAAGHTLSSTRADGPLRFVLNCISAGARALGVADQPQPPRIEIIAKQWWWEVRYRGARGEPIVLANELYLPAGRPVEVLLKSTDVIHSFWVPSLAGKVDMIPGRTNRIVLQARQPGVFRGQCAEYCGGQHAWMALFVVVGDERRFQSWLARQARPAAIPDDPFLKLGHEAFHEGGCGECHTVRGTQATGTSGPDLTHVGSRRSLAAGMLDNHRGSLAGWIAGAQEIKPGNLMPSTRAYTGEELRALAAWLESLK